MSVKRKINWKPERRPAKTEAAQLKAQSELSATVCSANRTTKNLPSVPKANFHIGDRVTIIIEEAGHPPTFDAIVCGIEANPRRYSEPEYAVLDLESGIVEDGYTERWMTHSPNIELSEPPPMTHNNPKPEAKTAMRNGGSLQ